MTEERFTGHSIQLDAAMKDAAKVLIAKIRHVGPSDLGAPGEIYFDDAKLGIVRWLRSDAREDLQKTELVVAYTVQRLPAESAEQLPEVDRSYLFFLKPRNGGSLRAIKILPAEDKYIHLVEGMTRSKHP